MHALLPINIWYQLLISMGIYVGTLFFLNVRCNIKIIVIILILVIDLFVFYALCYKWSTSTYVPTFVRNTRWFGLTIDDDYIIDFVDNKKLMQQII